MQQLSRGTSCDSFNAMSVGHYENFPVASWLMPARLRPAVRAIYRFARTADDLADEGVASPAERLSALDDLRAQLRAIELAVAIGLERLGRCGPRASAAIAAVP